MKVMFLGTSSAAGKTTLVALYCRYLTKKGMRVSPFKASNLSLNSYVTDDGREIGMGQAFQAWASSREPEADMNPILLKPAGKGVIQVIVNGRPYADMSPGCPVDTDELVGFATKSFDRLAKDNEAVICEGSGSPVEINLARRDIANMRMVKERDIPAVLVGDIERGGVFAAIYGTWRLVPEEDRHYLKGFIINRFRGDDSILKSGIDRIEELTGMKCLGIVPYLNVRFPEEDTMSSTSGKLEGDSVLDAYMNNLDELIDAIKDKFDFELLDKIASE